MTTAEHAVIGASSFKSVPDMWHHRVRSTPDSEAMTFRGPDGHWTAITWRESGARVRNIANGLLALGLTREQRCCLLAATSHTWVLADMAILCSGGATTTIYPSNTPEECEYIIDDCDAVFVFCDSAAQVAKLVSVRNQLPDVRHVITFDGEPSDDGWVITLAELERQGEAWALDQPEAYDQVSQSIGSEELATLIYTSGTTGAPKGVMLTHDAWVYESEAIDALGIISPADKQFLFLPLSHVFAKVMQITFIRLGVPTVVDGDIPSLVANLGETRPTWMGAVPRVFEKAYNKIISTARARGGLSWRGFKWAVDIGTQYSRALQAGKQPGGWLRMQHQMADKLVFADIRERFGGRLRFFISGGAPLSPEIAEFFHACGILILEGYGLTESSAASLLNRPEDYRFGTVGKPLPGCEVRIGDDGELLINSRGVMVGYYNKPDATIRSLEDGWLHTGDLARILDSGHVQITGRLKDLIVTAGGKNIAPTHFQGLLKARSPHVSQVLVHGDKRNFCTALVTINPESTGAWARDNGLSYANYADLASRPEVTTLIWDAVEAVNAELPSYETVKKIYVCPEDWTVDNGLLTATQKVRRNLVEDKYREVLEGFYEGTVAELG